MNSDSLHLCENPKTIKMSFYDEIEIEDMTYDSTLQIYHYPCPCGDRFEISIGDLRDGEDVAVCPSCSLMIKVIYDIVCKFFLGAINVCIPLTLFRLLCRKKNQRKRPAHKQL